MGMITHFEKPWVPLRLLCGTRWRLPNLSAGRLDSSQAVSRESNHNVMTRSI